MHLGHRHQVVVSLIVILVVGILLALRVPGAEARPQYQTVPTMPPPTKSPTVTPSRTQIIPTASTPTSPALPSPTNAQASSTPLTPTMGAVVSTAAATFTATMAETKSIPIESPTSNVIVSNGSVVPQYENPLETESVTSTPLPETSMSGISQIWLLGLVIAGVVLGLAVGLARWMLRKRSKQHGNDET
jgi:hypothetical protein